MSGRLPSVLALAILLQAQPEPLALKSQQARQAMAQRRFDDAARLYRDLAAAVPANPGLHMNLALALHSGGRFGEAISELRTVIRLQPALAAAHLLLGMAHQKRNEPRLAEAPLREALRLEPAHPIATLELADSLLATGRPEQAVPLFAQLDTPKGLQGLGLAYTAVARRAFEALERRAPDSGFRDALLARSLAEQRQPRAAFRLYRSALAKEPNLPGIHGAVAGLYRELGKPEWATQEQARETASCAGLACDFAAGRHEALLTATALSAEPAALYWRSRAASELALAAFSRLANLPIDTPELHELKAEAMRIQNRHNEAVTEWRAALRAAPDDARLRRELARSLWQAGQYEATLQEVESLPRSALARFLKGDSLARLERSDEAIPPLREAVALDGTLREAHAALGRLLAERGQPQAAIPHLESGKALDPSLLFTLSKAYQATGQAAKAKATLQEYQSALQRRSTTDEDITPP